MLQKQVFIQNTKGQRFAFDFELDATINDVMLKITDRFGMAAQHQALMFAGKLLHKSPEKRLLDLGIISEDPDAIPCTINWQHRLPGGGHQR